MGSTGRGKVGLSTTNPRSIRARGPLAAAICLTALAVGSIGPACAQAITPPDPPCNIIAGIGLEIITCTGNLSPGVNLTNGSGPYEVLNVHSLTTNITPASGVPGILFTSDGSVEMNVDTGAFGISTTGDDAPGVFAASANGSVAIHSFADIITTGNLSHGISAESFAGDINILARGTIQTSGDAIAAMDGAFGIAAMSLSGDITIVSAANITTTGVQGVGIFADTTGIAMVDLSGTIITRGEGAAGIAAAGQTRSSRHLDRQHRDRRAGGAGHRRHLRRGGGCRNVRQHHHVGQRFARHLGAKPRQRHGRRGRGRNHRYCWG